MDRREQVIARLVVIAAGVPGIVAALRNVDTLSERQRPGFVIFDGDEAVELPPPGRQGPSMVTMTPEIALALGDKSESVGTALNTLRAAFLKAALTDTTLRGIVGPNGRIHYAGCASAFARGRTMEGEMGISLSIEYPLNPAEL